MNKFKLSILTGALLGSSAAFAQITAITNVTVHTQTDQGVLENATVVMEGGKIKSINPQSFEADVTIDANGKVMTPGLIGSMNHLGLVEVGAVSRSVDAYDKSGIEFDPSSAFNPRSSLIPYARKGGVTQNISVPSLPWGESGVFMGLAFVADLSGEFGSVTDRKTALIVDLGAASGDASRAAALQSFTKKLAEQEKKLKSKKDKKKDADPSSEEKLLTQVLKGELPVVAYASRASQLLELLALKEKFGLNLIISGADDAVLVKEQLAKAEVPVIVSAISNLPTGFDALHAHLGNAGELEKAGVKVILNVSGDGSHNVYQMRFDAGIAVANGMTHDGALKAMTVNVADAFGIEGGKIAKGERADVVLWTADPFEFSTRIDKIWINGEQVTTESRHDKLRERYTTDSNMPRAYTK
ncbi:amidohydrolase family protein [Pseudoalteromonas luteoviolacea]|uniref:amidohydrolase family protein n=1 Tax=Pseudoalteromonas luteoviolacea TaxID=43657 RepID=UPI001151CD73|nr:amidohydrolase family protein [Pseudoalteromonas luteoviolacea]TQF70637.1 amidohydrolase family protein [Pseudoalteromonas luteoviolacea]